MNAEPFFQIDKVIHEKGRLSIMSLLAATAELSFTELRDTLRMTDGNLSVHLRTLQEAGYVAVTKSFVQRRPLTTCRLTEAGRRAFGEYIVVLERIVEQARVLDPQNMLATGAIRTSGSTVKDSPKRGAGKEGAKSGGADRSEPGLAGS